MDLSRGKKETVAGTSADSRLLRAYQSQRKIGRGGGWGGLGEFGGFDGGGLGLGVVVGGGGVLVGRL